MHIGLGADHAGFQLEDSVNVLTLGARATPESRVRDIVRAFVQPPFEGGRHAGRVSKIHAIEQH